MVTTRGALKETSASSSAPNEPAANQSDNTWVECDLCKKWRRLSDVVDASQLPSKWHCDMNVADPTRAHCSAPEEEYGDEESVPSNAEDDASALDDDDNPDDEAATAATAATPRKITRSEAEEAGGVSIVDSIIWFPEGTTPPGRETALSIPYVFDLTTQSVVRADVAEKLAHAVPKAQSVGYYAHYRCKRVAQYHDPVQSAAVVDDPSKSDGVDLSGKTFLVTGANQGVGKEIATYAASKKATVYLLCRNKERAESAQKDIQELTKNDKVSILLGDVSEPSHIRRIASEFLGKEQKLDCLVCNAGALLNERRTNSEGKEVTLMSHLVCGSYQLTKLLLPSLKKASEASDGEARVVYVSSGGMLNSKFPEWDVAASTDEASYNGNLAYSYAKRGQVLLAERFTKEYPDVGFVSCHPGWVRTAIVDDAYGSTAKYLEPFRTVWEGSEGICWLTATPRKNLEGGEFYLDRKPGRKHIAGPFMTDGTFTKNSEAEVDEMLKKLQEEVGV